MRPVERGEMPKDGAGNEIVFKEHGDARKYLKAEIGEFCSYCETGLHSVIAVEHIYPKAEELYPERALFWTNFLLSCTYCNSIKGTTDPDLQDYYWPHRDNTARPFIYRLDLAPRVADGLSQDQRQIAQSTLELTGLDREPGHPDLSPLDPRWNKRREAWGVALRLLQKLRAGKIDRESVLHNAISRGFWSVWMEVFKEDIEMRRLLISSFKVPASCFNVQTQPLPRPEGLI